LQQRLHGAVSYGGMTIGVVACLVEAQAIGPADNDRAKGEAPVPAARPAVRTAPLFFEVAGNRVAQVTRQEHAEQP
jgi:hypothetical protein